MIEPSETWIGLPAAVRMATAALGNREKAIQRLCELLTAGVLTARSASAKYEGNVPVIRADFRAQTVSTSKEHRVSNEVNHIIAGSAWGKDDLGASDGGWWDTGDGSYERFEIQVHLTLIEVAEQGLARAGFKTEPGEVDAEAITRIAEPGRRATHEEAVRWCVNWRAMRRSAGLGRSQNVAWQEFRNVPSHAGLSRDHAFRDAFNESANKIV